MKYEGKYGTLEIDENGSLGYKPEVYCTELNLGGELTADNVKALLDEINAFRAGRKAELEAFFGGGGVYNVFIKHIARPTDYPIYDYHVLNAYYRLEKGLAADTSEETTPERYGEYRAFFFKVYEAMFGTGERKNDLETVTNMKRVDNALFEYDKAHGKKIGHNRRADTPRTTYKGVFYEEEIFRRAARGDVFDGGGVRRAHADCEGCVKKFGVLEKGRLLNAKKKRAFSSENFSSTCNCAL